MLFLPLIDFPFSQTWCVFCVAFSGCEKVTGPADLLCLPDPPHKPADFVYMVVTTLSGAHSDRFLLRRTCFRLCIDLSKWSHVGLQSVLQK